MATRNNRDTTYRMALSALLLAMMLILGYVESMIPLNAGIPGIKLGLSNGVLIFAVYMLDVPTSYILMAMKVLLSGMMFGSPSMMMYGFAGGLLSLTAMCLLSRIPKLPVVIVSLIGGIMHNAGQVGLAMVMTATPALAWYMLILAGVGAVCGVLTGVCATLVMKHLKSAGFRKPTATKGSNRRTIIAAVLCVLIVGIIGATLLQKQQTATQVTWDTPTAPTIDLPVPKR